MDTAEEIYVLGRQVRLQQPEDGFKTGLDAVMLAAACPVQSEQSLLDLGCGTGAAGLCVLQRVSGVTLTGVDIQENHIALAQNNAALNHKKDDCSFVCANIQDYKSADSFDHVICNPPYLQDGAHLKSPSAPKAAAMGHDMTALEDWIACAFDHIKGQGSFTMIHRADHIDHILQNLGKRFGAVELIPLWPRAGAPAKRVILRAWKHKKTPATLHSGLTLHKDDGNYTDEAERILRHGASLFL